jgi:hypothetical protein
VITSNSKHLKVENAMDFLFKNRLPFRKPTGFRFGSDTPKTGFRFGSAGACDRLPFRKRYIDKIYPPGRWGSIQWCRLQIGLEAGEGGNNRSDGAAHAPQAPTCVVLA